MNNPAYIASTDRIAALRGAALSGQASGGGGSLGGSLFCDLDPECGQTSISFASPAGSFASLDIQIEGKPRWVVLRLELGTAGFKPGDVLGVALQGAASRSCEIGAYLRLVRDGVIEDTSFGERLNLGPRQAVRTVLRTLSAVDPACGQESTCALVLGLPLEDIRIDIADLHFFVLDAEEGLRSTPVDLSSFAA